MIGNLGGFIMGLTLFFTFLIGIFNFNRLEHFLIETLFTYSISSKNKSSNAFDDFLKINLGKITSEKVEMFPLKAKNASICR